MIFFLNPILGLPECPQERGFCVKENGEDQNSGVMKQNSLTEIPLSFSNNVYRYANKRREQQDVSLFGIRETKDAMCIPRRLPEGMEQLDTPVGFFLNVLVYNYLRS